ncbi:asparaginase [Paucibacter sp. R3-3]|uniref:Asparaginase n=1 Tax=Roseateles agri TaxID=3098619 RepID=A0ABU5DH78_9BURK|nr:asparaginase [Paucibacter sp. R3-3]MDY0745643.1 asparaginase [Paucibacter sp. R3-3]
MTRDLIVILGTGGTIAGTATDAADNVGYTAAQIGVDQLIAAVPQLASRRLEHEQVAQLDSKDMDFATWQRIAEAAARHLARPEVSGLVITHGTDTLEETAWFLQRVLAPTKPVVITAAMRPATALLKDGSQNLLDAVTVAADREVAGVVVAFAGQIHSAEQVRKVHSYKVNAFASAEGAQLGVVEEGIVRWFGRSAPAAQALGMARISRPAAQWPRVQIVMNHVGADGAIVDALLAQGVDGIVVAGTGNGTLSAALERSLEGAQAGGVKVLRSTRCDAGPVMAAGDLPSAGALSPVKSRIELILELLARS